MNVLFSDIRHSYSIVCDTAHLKMLLSVQDLMLTFCMEEEGKLKQIMKLYPGKLLLPYVHRKSVLRTHGEQREGWSAEHPILPQGHRENILKTQNCDWEAGHVFLLILKFQ